MESYTKQLMIKQYRPYLTYINNVLGVDSDRQGHLIGIVTRSSSSSGGNSARRRPLLLLDSGIVHGGSVRAIVLSHTQENFI